MRFFLKIQIYLYFDRKRYLKSENIVFFLLPNLNHSASVTARLHFGDLLIYALPIVFFNNYVFMLH